MKIQEAFELSGGAVNTDSNNRAYLYDPFQGAWVQGRGSVRKTYERWQDLKAKADRQDPKFEKNYNLTSRRFRSVSSGRRRPRSSTLWLALLLALLLAQRTRRTCRSSARRAARRRCSTRSTSSPPSPTRPCRTARSTPRCPPGRLAARARVRASRRWCLRRTRRLCLARSLEVARPLPRGCAPPLHGPASSSWRRLRGADPAPGRNWWQPCRRRQRHGRSCGRRAGRPSRPSRPPSRPPSADADAEAMEMEARHNAEKAKDAEGTRRHKEIMGAIAAVAFDAPPAPATPGRAGFFGCRFCCQTASSFCW